MSKPVIAVDIDDVLFPMSEHYVAHFNREHDTSHTVGDLHEYFYIEELHNLEDMNEGERIFNEFMKYADEHKLGPHAETVQALSKLAERYEILAITARDPQIAALTERWIHQHFQGVVQDLHFLRDTAHGTSKPEMCRKLEATVMIDDHPDHLVGCAEAGVRGLLFGDFAWSRGAVLPDGVERVRDWNEVLEKLL